MIIIMSTNGVISAGHPLSAEAGACMFRKGGNAFDAAAAAAFAGCVVEPTLTGLGGGGFANLHHGPTKQNTVLDFFVSFPGKDLSRPACDLQEIEIIYGLAPQIYHIGPASCAVPGFVKGIVAMQSKFGMLALDEVLAPAITLASRGFELTPKMYYNLEFVEKVVLNTQTGRDIFAPSGSLIEVNKILRQPELASALEIIAKGGEEAFYQGEIAERIIEWSEKNQGLITAKDLAEYRVIEREAIKVPFCDYDILLPPPPSSGGILTAFSLSLWEKLSKNPFDSQEGADLFLRIMRRANQLRGRDFDQLLYEGGLVEKIMEDEVLARATSQVKEQLDHPPSKSPFTTQISALDEYNNAASLTCSTGIGSGEFVPKTGIQLSNMLGESDLYPADYEVKAGERMTSMMAPSIVMEAGKPILATGSAGSTRIRTAIFQTLLRYLEAEGNVASRTEKAVQSGRLHLEGDLVHLEAGTDPSLAKYLRARGFLVQTWEQKHLYFGGVNMAARSGDDFAGSGDERRGALSITIKTEDGQLDDMPGT